MRVLLIAATLSLLSLPAHAGNKPCSGKKGGISHCQGSLFICKDGSASKSKRSCTASDVPPVGPRPKKSPKP